MKSTVFETGGLVLVNWHDSKSVFVKSNFESICLLPSGSVKGWSKKQKKITYIDMFSMILSQNFLWEEST